MFKGVEGVYCLLELGGLKEVNPMVGIFVFLVMDWDRFKRFIEAIWVSV